MATVGVDRPSAMSFVLSRIIAAVAVSTACTLPDSVSDRTYWTAVPTPRRDVVPKVGELASNRVELLSSIEDVAVLHSLP